ncbi:MAG: trypsin-like peptidase domain-containing protein [Actinobacteria bacterium]|nr:trypsin-like peptidase domain-containing protein [Actinomycetota bacterium]
MSDFDDFERHQNTGRAVLKGCGIALLIVVSIVVGVVLTIGALAATKGVLPFELFKRQAPPGVSQQQTTETETPKTQEATQQEVQPPPFDEPVVYVAKKVEPSVVNIKIYERETADTPRRLIGEGSGVIYRPDGYIISNNHVVELGEKYQLIVTLATGQEHEASIVGRDPLTDLAVVKIDQDNLPAADFGTSRNLQIGELVVAIGSPFGLEASVTAGVISALHRNIETGSGPPMIDLIQTDAAINPGNSGGALSNKYGKVIGINTLIFSTSGSSAGVGFAIPVDVAVNVADQIIATGKVSHPFIGIEGVTISDEISKQFNLGNLEGVYVVNVVKGGPAEKAGIAPGDVITAINGEQVKAYGDLIALLREHKVGERISVTIIRDGKEKIFEVKLIERPVGQ